MASQIPPDFDFANYDPNNAEHRRFLKIVIDERAQLAAQNSILEQELAEERGAKMLAAQNSKLEQQPAEERETKIVAERETHYMLANLYIQQQCKNRNIKL